MLIFMNNLGIQSRFAPLPKKLHLIFCVLATILFIVLYIRHRRIKDLLWLIVCDTTAILQFFGDKYTAFAVGVCEVILLAMIFFEHMKEKRNQKSDENNSKKDAHTDELDDIAKAVKSERSKLSSDTPDDVISSAFDGEDIGG